VWTKAFMWIVLIAGVVQAGQPRPNLFVSRWPSDVERVWVGPEYWANRLQDWHIAGGRLECIFSGPDRNVHLLTRQLAPGPGDFHMHVTLGRLGDQNPPGKNDWVGFRFAAKGMFNDYRHSAIYGRGIDAGVTGDGHLFVGRPGKHEGVDGLPGSVAPNTLDALALDLSASPAGNAYQVVLTASDPATGRPMARIRHTMPADGLQGNVALVCHGPARKGLDGSGRFWFRDWQVWGEKVEANDAHAFGPILFAQYTLSRHVLKMTAQMPPIGKGDAQSVRLDVKREGHWEAVAWATIDPLSRTAAFRIENWDDTRDVPYRLVYPLRQPDGAWKECVYTGTVRRDPVEKNVLVIAGFTGNNDTGFPNNDVVKHVKVHNPDMLVFTGDQIYERVAGYGTERSPVDRACLDYLRKWYLWGWSFGALTRDRPCVCLPDDHDVYHGNIWGAGGRHAEQQDDGGYKMPAVWVRMVERTQTSHLPDPYDPAPVKQGIGVYYTHLVWGGVSFAIIEDRKFKSSPTVMIPEGKVVNGWFQNPDFDPATQADVKGAVLLGDRQLAFLRDWAADWRDGIWMKIVLSQTIFANVATLPSQATSDKVVPKLHIFQPGEYPPDDVPAADADSNGWPQTGRNKALREMRKGFAFHLAGDQHLGSTIHYGVDDWRDAGVAVCVPAIANIWPRRWFPSTPGLNRQPGAPKYTGDFLDGFGNHVTVYAVSNPYVSGREPAVLYDRATGYGIVRLNRTDRTIRIECWPRYADPRDPTTGGPYPGWPITVTQADNYGRKAAAYLPTLHVTGMNDPVVQVVREPRGEIVYTLRIRGMAFRPKVFDAEASYTVHVGEPGTDRMKTLEGVRPATSEDAVIQVDF